MRKYEINKNERKTLLPKSLSKLRTKDIEYLMTLEWTEDDFKKMGSPRLENLPVHLRSLDFAISTRGNKGYVVQGNIVIPGSSVVQLYNPSGQMIVGREGWPHPVDPTGKFTNGAIYQAIDRRCVQPSWNKFCMVVGTPSIDFLNTRIPNWGASIGDLNQYWVVGVNEGGKCVVAFNDDTDNDNHGYMTQIIRIIQGRDFAEMYAHLIIENHEDEEMLFDGGGHGAGI